jgi:hypothetical protein
VWIVVSRPQEGLYYYYNRVVQSDEKSSIAPKTNFCGKRNVKSHSDEGVLSLAKLGPKKTEYQEITCFGLSVSIH